MIPDERLSTTLQYAPLVIPDPQPSKTVSRQQGGVALGNPIDGLQVKVWTAEVEDLDEIVQRVVIWASDVAPVTIFSDTAIEEISLAFDQNMRPTVAYKAGGVAKLFWYDSVLQDFTITKFEDLYGVSGIVTSPRCTLDDHRDIELARSDIIIVFIQDGNMYFIAQRDRYTIRYLLYADINLDIINPTIEYVAMNKVNRLQIEVRGNLT